MAINPIEEQENATKPPKLDIPEPENSGVLTSQDANDFVSEKTNELGSQVNEIQGLLKTGGKDPQISEIQQFLNTSGKYENLGDGQYHIGLPGSLGTTFDVQVLEADPGAKGYIESVKAGADPERGLGMSIARGTVVRGVQDRYKTQREALAESQKQAKASTQASEFRSGRTGAGLQEESITAKTDQALERQRKDFQDAVQRNINAALDEIQAGNIRAFQEKQKMIADEKQSYLDELEQTQDIALKMQTYEEKAIKIGEDRRTSASKVIGDYAKAGTEITDNQFEIIAGTYGIDVEDARNIYNIAQVESSIALDKADQEYAKSELDIETKEFDLRKKQMDDYLAMADKIGVAVPVQIGNSEYTYYGYNSTREQNGTEYNKETGEFFHWSVDRTDPTRPRVTTTPISNIGVNWELKDLGTNGWWRVSPDGKQWLPATPGVTQVTNDQAFPEGSTPPPRPGGSPANAGQCGSYWGLKTGVTDMPADFDSFTGKKNYLEAKGAIDEQEIQAGTTFLQKAGTTGHIGFVGDVIYDPNTHEAIGFYADESNYVPPNGRKVSYSRPVYFNDPTLAGFYNVPVQNQIASGPDVSVQMGVDTSLFSSTGAIMTGKPGTEPTNIQSWASGLQDGSFKMTDIPQDIRADVRALAVNQGWKPQSGGVGISIPTLDEFKSSLNMSMPESEIQKRYNETTAYAKQIDNSISKISAKGKNADERAEIKSRLVEMYNSGDYDSLEEALRSEAVDALTSTQQESYNQFANGVDSWVQASTTIQNTQNITSGPYKSLWESKKPYLLMQKDQKFVDLFNIIELGQAQIRRGFYGTAVTPTEAQTAGKFLIQETDDMATIETKLRNGANYMQFVNDATVAQKLGMPRPKLSDYLTK